MTIELCPSCGYRTHECRCPEPPPYDDGDVGDDVDPLANMRDGAWLDSQRFPELQWVVPGIIPEGAVVLVGPPKVGKSWLVCHLSLAVALGGRALGAIDVTQRPVLYLALEDGDRRLQDRCRKVGEGDRLPAAWHRLLRLDDTIEATCRAFLNRHPGGAIFLDTLGKIMPPAKMGEDRYQRDYRMTGAVKAIVDEHPGSALVIVHHDRKAAAEDFVDVVSGSHGIAGAVDTIVVLHRPRLSPQGTVKVTGRDVPEDEYAVTFHDGHLWTLDGDDLAQAAAAAATRREQGDLGDRSTAILGYARSKAPDTITAAEVAERYDTTPNNAGTYLRRLTKSGRLTKDKRGHFRLPAPPSETSELSETPTLTPPESDTPHTSDTTQ